MKLDELVKRVRGERVMSLTQVSKAGKISRQTVFEVEHGMNHNLTVSTIMGLAKALKLKPDMILAAAIESTTAPKETPDGQPAAD